ncbi:MAG TPA: structural protein [Nitrococcus sp.]|nr:structural protein [Nitrococcus sp.]
MPAKALLIMGAALVAAGLGLSRAAPVLQAAGPGEPKLTGTRGFRNNNPGNIRAAGDVWVGQVGIDAGGYVIFDTPEHGLRALARIMLNYQRLHGIDTLNALVARYAPASDSNDESSYVQDLSARLGIGPSAPFSIEAMLVPLMQAIIRHENGSQPYALAQIQAGVDLA